MTDDARVHEHTRARRTGVRLGIAALALGAVCPRHTVPAHVKAGDEPTRPYLAVVDPAR